MLKPGKQFKAKVLNHSDNHSAQETIDHWNISKEQLAQFKEELVTDPELKTIYHELQRLDDFDHELDLKRFKMATYNAALKRMQNDPSERFISDSLKLLATQPAIPGSPKVRFQEEPALEQDTQEDETIIPYATHLKKLSHN